jgi:hypothetical protein
MMGRVITDDRDWSRVIIVGYSMWYDGIVGIVGDEGVEGVDLGVNIKVLIVDDKDVVK